MVLRFKEGAYRRRVNALYIFIPVFFSLLLFPFLFIFNSGSLHLNGGSWTGISVCLGEDSFLGWVILKSEAGIESKLLRHKRFKVNSKIPMRIKMFWTYFYMKALASDTAQATGVLCEFIRHSAIRICFLTKSSHENMI